MAETETDGGPAFPCQLLGQDGLPAFSGSAGMSVRTWLAGQALVGLLAGSPDSDCGPAGYAHDACVHADALLAMLAERAKTDTHEGESDG